MADVALEILLILAYLAIGLISVIFPIYAIAVTYLKTEKSEAEQERKNHLAEVKNKIHELTKEKALTNTEEDLKEINSRINDYEKQKNALEEIVLPLTAKGAVLHPIILLFVSLVFTILGIISLNIMPSSLDLSLIHI